MGGAFKTGPFALTPQPASKPPTRVPPWPKGDKLDHQIQSKPSSVEGPLAAPEALHVARKCSSVHAAIASGRLRESYEFADFTQDLLLEVVRKAPLFEPHRSSWRTFTELIVRRHVCSLARRQRTQFRNVPLDRSTLEAKSRWSYEQIDTRIDVQRVIDTLDPVDKRVAYRLMIESPIEVSRELCISRAKVYRSIERLRAAFEHAGMEPALWEGSRDR